MGNAGIFSCLHSVNSLNRYAITLSVGNNKKKYSICVASPGTCACLLKYGSLNLGLQNSCSENNHSSILQKTLLSFEIQLDW